ncbi:hypothetical protein GV792_12810 [Nocardia cyriacigeorgica]|uniref:hypothetical protein n=1 Tax=Nocardia cyriacigeorgica TaxID=135487 RepID=UPI0013BA1320|nr:hypothetical protein [Nocardia cyriacigeorgica]NEW50940.1 hypothetical protein [Nocardia cyriacigeorgica]
MSDDVAVVANVCLIEDENPEKDIFEQLEDAERAAEEARKEYEKALEIKRENDEGIARLEEQIRHHETHYFNRDGEYPGFYQDESHQIAWLYTDEHYADWKEEHDLLQRNLEYLRGEHSEWIDENLRDAERELEEAEKKVRELRKKVEERKTLDSLMRSIQRIWARWWKRLLATLAILGAILLLIAAGYTVTKDDPAPPKPAKVENMPSAPADQKAPPVAEPDRSSQPAGSDAGADSGQADNPAPVPAPAVGSGSAADPAPPDSTPAEDSGPAADAANPGPAPAPGSGPAEDPGTAPAPGPVDYGQGGGQGQSQSDSAPTNSQPGNPWIPDVNLPDLGGGTTDGYVPDAGSPGRAETPGLGSVPGVGRGQGQGDGAPNYPQFGNPTVPGGNVPGLGGGTTHGFGPGTAPGADTGTKPNAGSNQPGSNGFSGSGPGDGSATHGSQKP